LMQEIATEFEGLDKRKQIELADKLGLSSSIRLLQQGRGSITELVAEARELGVTTEEDAAIAADFQNSLTDVWQIVKQISRTLTRALVPILQELTTDFTEWWKINKDLIALKVPEWVDTFTKAVKFLTIAIGTFIAFRLIGHLLAIIGLMKTLTVATLAANASAFLLPALILAGILAIAALAEDAKVFFDGGESFIGDMIKKFPEWTNELHVVAAVFATLADLTTSIFEGWSEIFDLFSKGDFLKTVKGLISDQFILDVLGLKQAGGGGLLDAPSTLTETITPDLSFELPPNFKLLVNGKGLFDPASTGLDLSAQLPPGFEPRANEQGLVKIDNLNITVPGAGDPVAVATEVRNVFQQTAEDLQSTVDQ